MRVLVCIPCLLTGGTEIQTLSLVKALVVAGHQTTTICYFEHNVEMLERFKQTGCKVVCLSPDGNRPLNIWHTIKFLFNGLKRIIKDVKPDVAHVQYMAPGAIPIILLKIVGVKSIIATAHTTADIYSSLWLLKFIQKHILTAFTCITERAELSFFGTSKLYSADSQLAPKGNHFTIYNNLPDYIQIASQPKVFKRPVIIGLVSRLEEIKGMDLIVPAFKLIHEKNIDTRLLIVGDGSLRSMMEQQANDAGLSAEVGFVGRQPQERLQDYYDKIDILLIPSRSEGFGLTAIEGMARGCVVVASNVGGLPEVVKDGVSGLLHKPKEPEDLAEKVLSLLYDKIIAEKLSIGAIVTASAFSSGTYNLLISNLYQKIQAQL